MSRGNEFWSTAEINYQRMETSKGPVEYADIGQGPPILYFHGTGAGIDAAVIVERSLLVDGFWLIVPSRPGYSRTPISCPRDTTPNSPGYDMLHIYLRPRRRTVTRRVPRSTRLARAAASANAIEAMTWLLGPIRPLMRPRRLWRRRIDGQPRLTWPSSPGDIAAIN